MSKPGSTPPKVWVSAVDFEDWQEQFNGHCTCYLDRYVMETRYSADCPHHGERVCKRHPDCKCPKHQNPVNPKDLVDRNPPPAHYATGIEPWDYMESHGLDYWEGNVIKYVTRAGKKSDGEASALVDYRKARDYLNYLILREEVK